MTATASSLVADLQRRVGFDDAPDLLSETMIVARRRMKHTCQMIPIVRMWRFGIARATLLNHARGERRRLALADRIRLNVGLGRASQADDDGDEVRDAIARLGPDRGELVRLVH